MSNDSSIISLDVRKLDYRYPSGQQALSDISFSITAGERVGIVGPSGAGKSTLLMHFNGLLPEESSARRSAAQNVSVHVDGLPMLLANLREIRSRVGFLFQDPDDQLFCPTVREDVAFGPLNQGVSKTDVEERISESLSAVGLTGYADRSTLQLSVGERKRVCLAGVLACRPSLLALDEPSSNLDPRARRGLLEILGAFPGSQIIATHDLDLVVAHCQRVLVLDEGQIHGDGPPHVVLSDEILMERHGLEVPLRLRFDVGGTP